MSSGRRRRLGDRAESGTGPPAQPPQPSTQGSQAPQPPPAPQHARDTSSAAGSQSGSRRSTMSQGPQENPSPQRARTTSSAAGSQSGSRRTSMNLGPQQNPAPQHARTTSSAAGSQSGSRRSTMSQPPPPPQQTTQQQPMAPLTTALQGLSVSQLEALRNPTRPVPTQLIGPLDPGSYGPVAEGVIGKPFRCKHEYRFGSESLDKGDEGKIEAEKYNETGHYFVRVQVPHKNKRVWVTPEFLDINNAVYWGELRFPLSSQVAGGMTASKDATVAQTQFGRALELQLSTMKLQAASLGLSQAAEDAIATPELRGRTIGRLVGGMPAELLKVLNSPNFTIQDIIQAGKPATQEDSGGIYMNIYTKFKTNWRRKAAVRVGKAHTISKRAREHIERGRPESNWHKEESHYSVARQAGQKIHIVLCVLGTENDRTIAEQVFINLFECWAINAIPLQTPESIRARGITDEKEIRRKIMVAQMCHAAYFHAVKMRDLSQAAAEMSHWPGLVDRESSGAGQGLNITMPLWERSINDRILWTRVDIPGICAIFRRHPCRVSRQKNQLTLLHLQGAGTNLFFHLHATKYNLKEGDLVYPRVEIRLDGKAHAQQLAQLPELKVWQDHDEATSVAVFFEYQDDSGKWYELSYGFIDVYIVDESSLGTLRRHANAIALYNYLMRRKYSGVPTWQLDLGLARVHKVDVDHYTQTLTFTEMTHISTVQLPNRKKLDKIGEELEAAGAQHLATKVGWRGFPGRTVGGHKDRVKCDNCFMQIQHRAPGEKRLSKNCDEGQNSSCKDCFKSGIMCSWTPEPIPYALKKLIEMPCQIDVLAYNRGPSVYSSEDPKFITHRFIADDGETAEIADI